MVGYLNSQVREAQERVRSAIRNTGIFLEPRKITLNLSPADLRKEGTAFDLPIALALLKAYGILPENAGEGILTFGELSLNGEVKPVAGVLPVAMLAEKRKMKCLYGAQKESGRSLYGRKHSSDWREKPSGSIGYLEGACRRKAFTESL